MGPQTPNPPNMAMGQMNTGQVGPGVPVPSPQDSQDPYMDKLKKLRRYIEPLNRLINRREGHPDSKQDVQKMRSLRDILIGQQKVTMPILEKCERVLQQIAGPPGQDPTPGTDPNQHMCQALLDVVSGNIKKPNINHTLNRTFKPVMDKLRPEPCAAPRREKSYAPLPPCPARNPKEIPSILQGEVAALNKKFRAQLNNSYLNASGDIHIIVQINDPALPPVRPLKVTIPVGYPKIPPIIEGENEQMTQFLDSGANIGLFVKLLI